MVTSAVSGDDSGVLQNENPKFQHTVTKLYNGADRCTDGHIVVSGKIFQRLEKYWLYNAAKKHRWSDAMKRH